MSGVPLVLGSAAALAAAAAVRRRGSRSAEPELWYHLTSKARFRLDRKYEPVDNSISIFDRGGRPGIYLAKSIEPWVNGHGYWRPFVVEFEVDPSVKDDPGVHGRWHSELFVPASSYGKLRVRRVIPLDAWCREWFGSYGWVERWHERAFDTGEAIDTSAWPSPVKGYRYTGPDVRQMPMQQVRRSKRDLSRFRKQRFGSRASQQQQQRRTPPVPIVTLEPGTSVWHGTSSPVRFQQTWPDERRLPVWVSDHWSVADQFAKGWSPGPRSRVIELCVVEPIRLLLVDNPVDFQEISGGTCDQPPGWRGRERQACATMSWWGAEGWVWPDYYGRGGEEWFEDEAGADMLICSPEKLAVVDVRSLAIGGPRRAW